MESKSKPIPRPKPKSKPNQSKIPPQRKRLLSNPNPNQIKPATIPLSSSDTLSSSSSDERVKKTRELPNLSDCHGCGVRINYTNPKERLQPLVSNWRVVLLCKKCCKFVDMGKLCKYCFKFVDDVNDCLKCCDCGNCVHKECVKKYGPGSCYGSGPVSGSKAVNGSGPVIGSKAVNSSGTVNGSGPVIGFKAVNGSATVNGSTTVNGSGTVNGTGSGKGFTICVDCWIPDGILKRFRVRKKKCREREKESLPESLKDVEINGFDTLGEEVERKVAAAVKAGENALRKAVVAKNAVALAKGVLNVVKSRKVGKRKSEAKVVDDVQLAFMLHRAINSSPRTSRYACLKSSPRGDDEPLVCYSRKRERKKRILMNDESLDLPLICYYRRRAKRALRKPTSLDVPLMCYSRRIDKRVSVSSAGLKDSNCGSNSDSSFNGTDCQENEEGRIDTKPHRYVFKYYRIGKGTPRPSVFAKDSDCGSCMNFANLITEDMDDTRDFGNGKECHEVCEKCEDNTNRFLVKYKRSKPDFSCEAEQYLILSNHLEESTTISDTRLQLSSQGEL